MSQARPRRGYREFAGELVNVELVDVPTSWLPQERRRIWPKLCYDKAFRYILDRSDQPGTVLIHGTVYAHLGDRWFGPIPHAWVELPGGVVFDGTLQRFYDRDGYYRLRRASAARSYARREAAECMLAHRHLGPWHEG